MVFQMLKIRRGHNVRAVAELKKNIGKGFSLKYSLFTMLVNLCQFTFNKSRNVHVKNFLYFFQKLFSES